MNEENKTEEDLPNHFVIIFGSIPWGVLIIGILWGILSQGEFGLLRFVLLIPAIPASFLYSLAWLYGAKGVKRKALGCVLINSCGIILMTIAAISKML